ncbi:MAG TPA: DNRLRE domain-containing protein, partial [Candidatus Nitrosotenuis sp.]|nr:DNRLRE domain-containing protein [Candidatus Nitrosotenuis sp.]
MNRCSRFELVMRLLLVATLVFPTPLLADEVQTLTATADATIRQGTPTTSDGTSTTLKSLSETSNDGRSLVKFNLSTIDAGSAIKNSALRMLMTTAPNVTRSLSVHMVTGSTDWTESGTWNTRDGVTAWGTTGGDFNAGAASTQATGTTANTQITWPVLNDGTTTNIPQFWLDNPSQNQGLIVRDNTEGAAPRAVVKQVLSGTETMTSVNCGTSCTRTTTMGASVDTSKSFLIFQIRSSCTRPQCSAIRGELNTSPTVNNQIFFTKSSNENSTVNIQWYVVEFEQGVEVIHGNTSQSATTINIAVPAITGVASTSQMFVLTSKTTNSADNNMNADDPIIGEMTTTTNLQLRCDAAAATHTIAYQVVAFTNPLDINVQKGSVSPVFGTAPQTSTQAAASLGTPVDYDKSFVLVNARGSGTFGGTDIGARMIDGELGTGGSVASFAACGTTCDTVLISRSIAGTPDTFTELFYQVVEIKNKSRVGSGKDVMILGSTSTISGSTSNLDGFDITRSVPFASSQMEGGGQYMGRSAQAASQGFGDG